MSAENKPVLNNTVREWIVNVFSTKYRIPALYLYLMYTAII